MRTISVADRTDTAQNLQFACVKHLRQTWVIYLKEMPLKKKFATACLKVNKKKWEVPAVLDYATLCANSQKT